MRQTLLNFRPPDERTAEFRLAQKTYTGKSLQYTKKNVSSPVPKSCNLSPTHQLMN